GAVRAVCGGRTGGIGRAAGALVHTPDRPIRRAGDARSVVTAPPGNCPFGGPRGVDAGEPAPQSTGSDMARLIDLSHEIEHGMVTYRGLPAPTISDWLSRDASIARYTAGTTFQIGKIELVANTGTYIDSPFHRYADGHDVAGYALESVADLPGIVVRASG